MKDKGYKEKSDINTGPWTPLEHSKFETARKIYKKWRDIASFIGTRSSSQCRSHQQKMELQKRHGRKFRVLCTETLDKESQANDFDILAETGCNPFPYLAFYSLF